jgi:hypothetical protein
MEWSDYQDVSYSSSDGKEYKGQFRTRQKDRGIEVVYHGLVNPAFYFNGPPNVLARTLLRELIEREDREKKRA